MANPVDPFLSRFSAPARRALEAHGITSAEELSKFTEKEVRQLHGIGPSSLPKLREALTEKGFTYQDE